jgi:hypothetical protein
MAQDEMRPFTTDGCSSFPDRSQVDNAEARLRADKELGACVLRVSGNKGLSELMFAGVRAGGGPYFYTSYRWGYGWAFGKGYAELTPEETAQADKLEKEYRDKHPTLMCPM